MPAQQTIRIDGADQRRLSGATTNRPMVIAAQ